ncbi:MAG: basic amino acid ABC transporter substrate-binding protein [Deltaproteobacteria bacterium]|nr:basic amino acid ABC transporter substrate-binding protein [Deltaproteobacteria bacterium]
MKRSKTIGLVLVVGTLFFLAAGPAVLAASSLDQIKARGVLVIGTDATYPPFEYVDKEGKIVGAEIDLGNELARRLGLKAKFINTAWDGIFPALNGKKFDVIISSVSITPKRQEAYDFSVPYKDSAQIVVVAKDNQDIKTKADLKGKKVGVQIGTTSEKEAKKVGGVGEVKAYSTFTEPFMELAFGRIDAIIINKAVAAVFINRYPEKFKTTGEPFLIKKQGVVIRKGEKELKEAIDKALKEMLDDGWIKKLREKYMI